MNKLHSIIFSIPPGPEFGICRVTEWLQTGFELVIGFIAHLQLGITSNYRAEAQQTTEVAVQGPWRPAPYTQL
jgi:hypothetical protein